jgi:hypothetical protein
MNCCFAVFITEMIQAQFLWQTLIQNLMPKEENLPKPRVSYSSPNDEVAVVIATTNRPTILAGTLRKAWQGS